MQTIQASPDLNPNNFGFLGTAAADATGTWMYTDTPPGGLAKRFYRATYP